MGTASQHCAEPVSNQLAGTGSGAGMATDPVRRPRASASEVAVPTTMIAAPASVTTSIRSASATFPTGYFGRRQEALDWRRLTKRRRRNQRCEARRKRAAMR
jgi:hypothetical protein